MPEELSIVVKGVDKYSATVKEMAKVTVSFCSSQEKMNEVLDKLGDAQRSLRKELDASKETLKALKKQFKETGDAALETQIADEQGKFDNIRRNLRLVNKEARAAETQMQRTGEVFSGLSNRSYGSGIANAVKGATKQLAMQMGGQILQQGLNAVTGSAFGDDMGSMISGAIGSAATGASLGMTYGLPGAAIGAALGGVAGVASGYIQNWEKRDNYFKSYYNGIIDQQTQAQEATIQSGSSIAGERERKKLAFSTLLRGEKTDPETYLNEVKKKAVDSIFTYDEITDYAKSLIKPFGAGGSLDVLQKLSDASAALSLSSGDTKVLIDGLSRMKLTNKTTQEYLNYFSERGIDVYEALGKWGSAGEVSQKVSAGEISGSDAAEEILKYLEGQYGGLSEAMANTYDGLKDNLGDIQANIDEAYGSGYNETRKEGMEAQKKAYEGKLGDELQELGKISGSLAGYRENLQEQYTREALGAVLRGARTTLYDEENTKKLEKMGRQYEGLSKEYEKTEDPEIGRKMENLRDQAEALAQNAFDSSEWSKKELSAEEENTKAIRALTASFDGWSAKYHAEQEGTKGQANVWMGTGKGSTSPVAASGYAATEGGARTMTGGPASSYAANGSHAAGLNRVPFDGYRAILHEGERVLTAQEARQADQGGGVTVNVTMNGATFREEADIQRFAKELGDQIALKRRAGLM